MSTLNEIPITVPAVTETREVPQIIEPESVKELSTANSAPAPIPEPFTESTQLAEPLSAPVSQEPEIVTAPDPIPEIESTSMIVETGASSDPTTSHKPTIADIEPLLANDSVVVPAEPTSQGKLSVTDIEAPSAGNIETEAVPEVGISRKPTIAEIESLLAGDSVLVAAGTDPERKPSIEEIEALLAGEMVVVPVKRSIESSPTSTTKNSVASSTSSRSNINSSPESHAKPKVVVKETVVTIGPNGTRSTTTTTTTKYDGVDTYRNRFLTTITRIWVPRELVPIIFFVRHKKREGADVRPIVTLMLKAVEE